MDEQSLELLSRPDYRQDRTKDKLTTWMVDQRSSGVDCPLVTPEIIKYVHGRRLLGVMERADRLLTYLVSETDELGAGVVFTEIPAEMVSAMGYESGTMDHTRSKSTNLLAYAWSESDDWQAVKSLLEYLRRRGYIVTEEDPDWSTHIKCVVTVEGYARAEVSSAHSSGRQAFVAMWFDPSMDGIYELGIAPAIEASGYEPKVINRDPTVDKIDDAIIAEIRKSRFIVADFTHGATGARGGVYFEAGLAMGLGIPVIFTCRHDMLDKLHFDTRQYNHIVWTGPEDLNERLRLRIEARIT